MIDCVDNQTIGDTVDRMDADQFDRKCIAVEEQQDEHAIAHGAARRLGTNIVGVGVYDAPESEAERLKAAGYEYARWRMRSGPSVWGWA